MCSSCTASHSSSSVQRSQKRSNAMSLKADDPKRQSVDRQAQMITMIVLLMIPKILKVLKRQSQEAVQRIAQGMAPIPPDYKERWAGDLYAAQKDDAVKALHSGWIFGGARLPNPQASSLPEEAYIPVTGTGDEFSRNDDFAPPVLARVLAFLAMVSKLSADTHARRIEKAFGATEGTNAERAKQVAEKMPRKDKNHGDLIAKSTVVWSSNEGTKQRYKAEGIKALMWVTMRDELVCESCREMDGRIVEIDGYFVPPNTSLLSATGEVLLTAPSWGISHPPLHARCRCGLYPVLVNPLG